MMNEILLFPGKAPGSEHVTMEEIVFEEPWEPHSHKQIVQGVTAPSLIPFLPDKPNGIAVMVIPGGAYRRQVLNLEGSKIAAWLTSFGVTAFVLKHRMPGDGHVSGMDAPLQDAQRAIRLIRSRSQQYGINPNQVGVMGFSAGGHLASVLGTCYDRVVYPSIDEADRLNARPDFLALCYPCISAKVWEQETASRSTRSSIIAEMLQKYGTDELITKETPVSFIMVADDDEVTPAEHSVRFYLALRRAGVSAELHAYRAGQHGFGMGTTRGAVQGWSGAFRSWLEAVIPHGEAFKDE